MALKILEFCPFYSGLIDKCVGFSQRIVDNPPYSHAEIFETRRIYSEILSLAVIFWNFVNPPNCHAGILVFGILSIALLFFAFLSRNPKVRLIRLHKLLIF